MAFWEVVIEGRQAASDMLTVLHYQSSGVEPPDFDSAATAIRGHLSDHLAALCAPRVTWVGITVREDILGGVGTFVPFPTGTLTGTDANGDQADPLAMNVRKLTGGLVRPTYGWIQQGGITAHALTAGSVWESTILDEVEAYCEDIRVLNIAGPSTLTMVIKASNPTAPNTQPYSVVNSFSATPQPRTQRTRIGGSGS